MNLTAQLLRQVDDPSLSRDERAGLRCILAKELEESGNYEAARGAMGELWQRIGDYPVIAELNQRTAAEVLLRAGVLTGWIGSAHQVEGAQETAKDLISESITIFASLDEMEKVAEAQTDLAYCYWREGAFDEARIMLQDVLRRLSAEESERRAVALLRSAIVERSATRYHDALRILTEAAPLFEASHNHAIKGKFHNTLAIVLEILGTSEQREDYTDRALVEYSAASFHFEQAGHTRFRARVENNLGFLLFTANKFVEAHEHLDYARRLFESLKDSGSIAQVDETRARAFLAQQRNLEAERVVRAAVRTLEKGGEQLLLAEALTTHGTALARLGQHGQAQLTLQRAVEVAHQAGGVEGAGLAVLAMIEELSERLTQEQMRAAYLRADQLLARSQHPGILARLRACARRVLAVEERAAAAEAFSTPNFVYAEAQTAALLRSARRIASTSGSVLITGETGTGKEVLARMIHEWSGRAGELVVVNCAALSASPIESQVFGHRRGSFADATQNHPGAARKAKGGTLLLDEIAELSLSHQGKLLRLIEHGEVHPIGAPEPERVDVRIIALTNRNLKELVATGQFRADLFYRLQAFHLEIAPLRERPADIPAIAEHFIKEARERRQKRVTFTPEAIQALRCLPLKGNARELHSLIERTVLAAPDGSRITAEAVEASALRQVQTNNLAEPWTGCSLEEEVLHYEGRLIKLALDTAQGSVTQAARLLGITHQGLSFILQGRHKDLQLARKPTRPRRRSIITAQRMRS